MGSKKKSASGSGVSFVGLVAIVAAAQGAQGFAYTLPAEHEALVKDGLVEVNPELRREDGALATRATAKGIEQAQKTPAAPPAWGGGANQPVTSSETLTRGDITKLNVSGGKPEFVIESGIELPKISNRGRTGESIYPFDQLEIGQSFFVGKDSKNLASTISGANKRHSELVTDAQGNAVMTTNRKGATVQATRQLRKFVVRAAEKDGVKGSRIWRVPVETAGEGDEA